MRQRKPESARYIRGFARGADLTRRHQRLLDSQSSFVVSVLFGFVVGEGGFGLGSWGGMDRSMETVEEEVEEYSWREVLLPRLIPVVSDAAPELERETGERRRGRELLVAVDFGPNSKHAFDWALVHFARMADTLHLVHAVSS